MKRFSKKGVLLFAGAMAVCAFVLPSAASASSWGVVGTHHVLSSPNLGFTSLLTGVPQTALCTSSSFTANVASAAALEITAASFGGLCTWTSPTSGTCTMTNVATRFPWTATAVTTSNIQIHGVYFDVTLEHVPGAGNSCLNSFTGLKLTLTGTLTGGNWTGGGRIDFNNAEGLAFDYLGPGIGLGHSTPVTMRALFTDPQTSLTVT